VTALRRLVPLVVAAATVAGCATGPTADPRDPLEPFNREVSRINDDFDKGVLKPIAVGYTKVVPSPVRAAVDNFFSNVSDVYSAVNNLLQGKPTRAAEDTMRVAINSVLGIGGLIDIATPAGLPKYKEDFGQTLGVWGMPPGPYLVLPLFGPSSVRDTAGMLVDRYFDPSAYIDPVSLRNSLIPVRIVAGRAQLLEVGNLLEEAALDKYTFLRDSYLQRRRYQVYDGNPPEEKPESEEGEGQPPAGGAAPASAPAATPATPPAPATPAAPASAPAATPVAPASEPAATPAAPASAPAAPPPGSDQESQSLPVQPMQKILPSPFRFPR